MSGLVAMIACGKRDILSELVPGMVRQNFTGQANCMVAVFNRQSQTAIQRADGTVINAFPYLMNDSNFRGSVGIGYNGDFDGHHEPIVLDLYPKAVLAIDASRKTTAQIAETIQREPQLKRGIILVMQTVKAPFALIAMHGHCLIGARNSGLKPLCFGQLWDCDKSNRRWQFGHFIASQSGVVNHYCRFVDGIHPGEIITMTPRSIILQTVIDRPDVRRCIQRPLFLEIPGSICAGKPVINMRQAIGYAVGVKFKETILRGRPADDFVALSLPLGGNFYLYGFGQATGISSNPGGIVRTMYPLEIEPAEGRPEPVNLNVIKEVMDDKEVIIVDDEIISGHKIEEIAHQCYQKGAKGVHAAVGAKLLASCPDREAPYTFHGRIGRRDADALGVDTLTYLKPDELIQAINTPNHSYCYDCLQD